MSMDPISVIASYRASMRRSVRRKHEIYATVKRAFDILVVCATAPAVMLVIAIAAFAILIAEGRPYSLSTTVLAGVAASFRC